MKAIFHRTSIRKYTAEPLTEEEINQLLRAAMAAPSACNQQPWEYYVVTDPAMVEKLASATPFSKPCLGAAAVLVPCCRKNGLIAPPCAPCDMSASIENLLLEADELGLGACWMALYPTRTRTENVRTLLGIPEELEPFALVSCGHPGEEKQQQDRFDESRVHWVR